MALPTRQRPDALDACARAGLQAQATAADRGGTMDRLSDPKTKRITLKVSKDIDLIRDRLAADTGIEMTYNQIFNFLVHFYVERASEPKSKWRSLS
jgi:hypothetical protein